MLHLLTSDNKYMLLVNSQKKYIYITYISSQLQQASDILFYSSDGRQTLMSMKSRDIPMTWVTQSREMTISTADKIRTVT